MKMKNFAEFIRAILSISKKKKYNLAFHSTDRTLFYKVYLDDGNNDHLQN